MLYKTRGIVLHSIPYNDKYSIIYMYTESFGRVAYLVARTRGKKSNLSRALFMPLSVLEMEVDHKHNRDLHRVRETKSCFPINELSSHPVKNVLALFLSEVLFRVVKETEPDARLFEFLYQSVLLLELSDKGLANFHLVFLLRLLHYLGIFPNSESIAQNSYFDMLNGVFIPEIPMHKHYLDKPESEVFATLLRMSYENMAYYHFSRHDRTQIIQRILPSQAGHPYFQRDLSAQSHGRWIHRH